MARDDWFRNISWDAEIEAEFRRRLHRARDRSQYLRIQAACLAETHPDVSLTLIDQYFALDDRHFDVATAHGDRARAFVALGDLDAAIMAYETALARERDFPKLLTQAYLDFADLVVNASLERFYARALDILDANSEGALFPIDRYRADGMRAVLLDHFGRTNESRSAAMAAMAAAKETKSGFQNHQNLGLVEGIGDTFGRRVAALAE